jgi:hypothetical protein
MAAVFMTIVILVLVTIILKSLEYFFISTKAGSFIFKKGLVFIFIIYVLLVGLSFAEDVFNEILCLIKN